MAKRRPRSTSPDPFPFLAPEFAPSSYDYAVFQRQLDAETQKLQLTVTIHSDMSDVHAHVSMVNEMVYVFDTAQALYVIKHEPCRHVVSYQSKVTHVTSLGILVPIKKIPTLVEVPFPEWDGWRLYDNDLETPEKGRLAEQCVQALIDIKPSAIWRPTITVEQIRDRQSQLIGHDYRITAGPQKVQVKCDARAGDTGNVYIEYAERNPRGLHS